MEYIHLKFVKENMLIFLVCLYVYYGRRRLLLVSDNISNALIA